MVCFLGFLLVRLVDDGGMGDCCVLVCLLVGRSRMWSWFL